MNAFGNMKNKVQLIGHLGKDPEIRVFDQDASNLKKVATLMLATNESYKNDKGEKVTETQWHTIKAFGKLAEIVEKYLVKGIEIAIEGKLVTRSYTDKQGSKRYVTEVQANELLILSKKG